MTDVPDKYKPLQQHAGVGASDVFFQRQHQFDLGFTIDHDAENHTPEELTRIGSCYILYGCAQQEGRELQLPVANWPKDTEIEWRDEDTPKKYIVKGAAYICAALDLEHALDMVRRQEELEAEQAPFVESEVVEDE